MKIRRLSPLLLILGGFAIRLYRLGFQSIWYDEAVSLLLAHKSIPALTAHTAGDIHPPLYYYLLHLWIRLAGDSEFAACFLSLWFGVLLIALTYHLGCRLFDRRVALYSALLVATSPYNIWYSQELRMYTLGASIGLLALEATLIGLEHPRSFKPWAMYAVLAAMGLYTLYYFAFLLVALNAFLIWKWLRDRRNFPFSPWLLAQVMALFLYLPWLGIAFRQATNPPVPPWRSFTPLGEVIVLSWTALSFGQSVEPKYVWPFLLISAWVYVKGLCEGARGAKAALTPLERATLLATYTLGPLAIIHIFSYITPLYHPRYLFVYSPPFYIVLAAGLCSLGKMELFSQRAKALHFNLSYVVLAILLAVSGWSVYRFHFDPHYASDDHRGAVAFLEQRLRPGDAVLINAGYVYPTILYYYRGPIGWRGRLVNYEPMEAEGPVFLQSGSIGGAPSLGWGNPRSDFYPTTEEETASALEKVFAHHPRVWVYRCYDTVVDPEGFIRRWLDEHGLKFEDRLFAGESNLRVQGYLTKRSYTPSVEVGVPIGDRIELAGFDGFPTQVEAGGTVDVALYWRALKQLDEDYKVSLGLFGDAGSAWAQADEQPLGSAYPASQWPPGVVLYHPMRLRIPVGTPPGDYSLELTVYSPRTALPLPVTDETWGVKGVRVRLGKLRVLRPSGEVHPPSLPLPLNADFAGLVELKGAAVSSRHVKAGSPLRLEFLWHARTAPLPELIVFVQLLDEQGKLVAAREVMPVENRYPTSRWEAREWVLDRHRLFVPGNVPTGRYKLIVGLLKASDRTRLPMRQGLWRKADHVSLGYVQVEGRKPLLTPPPPPEHPVHKRLGDVALLMGFDVKAAELVPGGTIELTLYWQALSSAPVSYKVFVHLVGEDGRIWGQQDKFPQDGNLPTSAWIAGEYITDSYRIPIAPQAPPGTYRLVVGMYDPETGARLPIYDEKGQPLGDSIPIMKVKVVSPTAASPPSKR